MEKEEKVLNERKRREWNEGVRWTWTDKFLKKRSIQMKEKENNWNHAT